MLRFGLSLGNPSSIKRCVEFGELWENPDFDCGLDKWNPNHEDTQLVDNRNGTVTVSNTGDWAYASLMPDNVAIEPGDYVLMLNVTDIIGPGKASYRVGSSWTDVIHYDTTGVHEVAFTIANTTDNWSIGASGDENAVITYDRVSLRPLVEPGWWKIATLDETDIIAAYDFGWIGHGDKTSAYTDFVNGLIASDESGSVTWERNVGLKFDGQAISFPLPDGLGDMEISVVIEFRDASKRGALDAYFGWFTNDDSRFIFQQDFNNGLVRWSAGQNGDTFEVSPVHTQAIIGVSGPELYVNGSYKGEAPNGSPVTTSGQKMYLGGAHINGSIQQFGKFTATKMLVVKRKLTETEHNQIVDRMHGE